LGDFGHINSLELPERAEACEDNRSQLQQAQQDQRVEKDDREADIPLYDSATEDAGENRKKAAQEKENLTSPDASRLAPWRQIEEGREKDSGAADDSQRGAKPSMPFFSQHFSPG
jgi:hypothetical protein